MKLKVLSLKQKQKKNVTMVKDKVWGTIDKNRGR